MARLPPTGLTAPRVENAELQRFCDQLALQINGLAGEIARVSGAGRGSGAGTTTVAPPDDDPIPILETPPTPIGVEVRCGIGVCMVMWVNPFRLYRNHGLSHIYRATVDQFDMAVEVGTAEWLLFVDEGLTGGTEYFYWVVFESTSQVLGPPSDSVSGEPARSPAEVYAEFRDLLVSSPLAAALDSDITLPAVVNEEIQRISSALAFLASSAASDNRRVIGELESAIGTDLGPPPNTFRGATEALAEDARDMQSTGDAAWLALYDADPNHAIVLRWD